MNCLQNSEEYNHELKYIITLDGGTTEKSVRGEE